MNVVKRILTGGWVSSLLTAPAVVLAQFGPTQNFAGTAGGNDLPAAIVNIVNIFLILAAIIAALFIVIGGIRYITSRGDEDEAAAAKNTILYAVIGLIVIGLSAVIVNFVVSAISGA